MSASGQCLDGADLGLLQEPLQHRSACYAVTGSEAIELVPGRHGDDQVDPPAPVVIVAIRVVEMTPTVSGLPLGVGLWLVGPGHGSSSGVALAQDAHGSLRRNGGSDRRGAGPPPCSALSASGSCGAALVQALAQALAAQLDAVRVVD